MHDNRFSRKIIFRFGSHVKYVLYWTVMNKIKYTRQFSVQLPIPKLTKFRWLVRMQYVDGQPFPRARIIHVIYDLLFEQSEHKT